VPGLASGHQSTEYQMYRAGRDGNKPTASVARTHCSEAATGSTEVLKSPSARAYDEAVEYGRGVGRSNCVTTVHGGLGAGGHSNADSDQDIEYVGASRTLSLKTQKEILVVTETLVQEDSRHKSKK